MDIFCLINKSFLLKIEVVFQKYNSTKGRLELKTGYILFNDKDQLSTERKDYLGKFYIPTKQTLYWTNKKD